MTNQYLTPAVVLVADRTLSAEYRILFEGIFATMQTTHVPEFAMRGFLSRPVKTDNHGRAKIVSLGLRRVEAALLKYTDMGPEDIVCTTPEELPNLLGPWVKVVGVSSSDPLGMGMSNTTTINFWDGELYTSFWTRQMLEQIAQAKHKYNFKVVGGGAGAWQWHRYRDKTADETIDVIYEGYFESSGPKLFIDLIDGLQTKNHICETDTAAEKIQPIEAATMAGIIEISRGCGRGCKFCTMAGKKMEHLSPDTILADLETNVANGISTVVSASEDFFRYGSSTVKPDFDKLANLLEQMRKIKGLSFMQLDHANITSVLQLTDDQLREIRRLLSWEKHTKYLWVNMGIESANGNLVAANCPGKIHPFDPEDWEKLVRQAADKMAKSGFFSVFSIILGLPGETPDDIERTLKLVEYLGTRHAVIFPIFYEPLASDEIRFTVEQMNAQHLKLFRTCYEINFRQVPRLFRDNQRAAGVSYAKRMLIQLLGKGETLLWKRNFTKIKKRISNRSVIEEASQCPTT